MPAHTFFFRGFIASDGDLSAILTSAITAGFDAVETTAVKLPVIKLPAIEIPLSKELRHGSGAASETTMNTTI